MVPCTTFHASLHLMPGAPYALLLALQHLSLQRCTSLQGSQGAFQHPKPETLCALQLAAYILVLQGCLDAFQHLSPGTFYALLLALWPLSHYQPDIQPAVISLLRRAMFSRDLSMRLTAVRGFVYVILQVTVLPQPVNKLYTSCRSWISSRLCSYAVSMIQCSPSRTCQSGGARQSSSCLRPEAVTLCRQPPPHSLPVLIRVTKHVKPLLLSAGYSSACCLQELTSLKGEQEDGHPPVQVLPCEIGPGPGHLRVSWGGAMPLCVLLLMLPGLS